MYITLYETDELRLEHKYEYVQLIQKTSGEILFSDDFYGDPQCGLIDENNMWAMVAGEHLTIWREGKLKKIESLKDIHSLRVKESDTVEILIDPWAENSAVWEINTQTFELNKIREFSDYHGEPYTDDVIW